MAPRAATAALACASWVVASEAGKRFNGHKSTGKVPFEYVLSAMPHMDPLVLAGIPDSFDWRNVNGQDFMASVKNQHEPGPTYCGACWAFATTGHLNARFNVARGNAWPRSEVSVQVLVSCSSDNGCGGSEPDDAMKFIHEHGLPHESCHTYQGKNLVCDKLNICQDCMADYEPVCWARPKFPLFKVKEYGTIRPDGDLFDVDRVKLQRTIDGMVTKMKAEVFKRGPMVCQIACPDPRGGIPAKHPYRTNTSGRGYGGIRGYVDDYTPFFNIAGDDFEPFILHDKEWTCETGDYDSCVDHDVVIAGWGSENGTPYWLIQNSWGEWWGEGGYFRIVMGKNNLGIESGCFWGVPDLEGFDETKNGLQKFPVGTSADFEKKEKYESFATLAEKKLEGFKEGIKEEFVTIYS